MDFEFATAGRILFGRGVIKQLGALGEEAGRQTSDERARALVVGGRSKQRIDISRALLEERGIESTRMSIEAEPTSDDAQLGVELARETGTNIVVAIGGGSVLDAGKAIAALVANRGDPLDYLEVIGKGAPLRAPSLPCIAVPTTAGTGSEVTRNAVLEVPSHRVKVSLRSHYMLPTIALVDPELTLSVPPPVTASTGFDALSQVIEPFVSNRANPLTDGLCREAITRSARSLRRAYVDGSDVEAREDLCVTSLFGGIALANAKLGAVHGFAGPIGGMFHSPHGATCAALLPHVVRMNIGALSTRAPDSPVRERYTEVARLLTSRANARAEDAVEWLLELSTALGIPSLESYGIRPSDFDGIVQKATVANSMQGNPIVLEPDELYAILESAL